ncbi:MAG TPA: aminopeptidase P family protein [Micropepsaceae bacterium]|nr:aminopeptidase P family protein [Micropepsaceae bacterium]
MNMPFQTFDEQSDASQCAPRLAALRAELAARGVDGFLIPRADEHQGEYVPKRAERLAWLTGFTGSAGLAAVLMEKAAVFVDGRYTLQVRNQTDTGLFETLDLMNDGPVNWLEANLTKGARLGYDPWLHTQANVERLKQAAERAGAQLVALDSNPLDAVWPDQPEPPRARAVPHPIELAGETSQSKRARLAEDLKKRGADAAVLTLPDSVCWLLNIRGADVPHTPFALAFAILNADATVDLFMDAKKSSPELVTHLGNEVRLAAPEAFGPALDALKGKTALADPVWAAAYIFQRLEKAGAKIIRASDPCQLPKACKNAAELDGTRRAHIRDGRALTRFLAWFAAEAPKGQLTEIDTVEKLESFRAATGALKDVSFDSISGAGPNGAIVHYRVTKKTNRRIEPNQLFLIDSGAQFVDGTTDVTRTVAVGTPTPEMRDRFTRVLKGHIQLALARFPEGTTGAQLDAFARRPLWDAGLDYGHGTGHGVGSYLSVHEGPQSISSRGTAQALKPGMICSNEPGFYKTGEFGIRIENLVVVREASEISGGEKKMLGFETITMAPIDLECVEPSMLTAEEKAWLNAYHATVRDAVAPAFADDANARAWLERATRTI